jgi:putative DNA primase/helicase
MVCLVRDTMTDEPKGIHRTALDHEGRAIKINGNKRLSFGPIAGGGIKTTPDEDVTTCFGIGEGLETTLSLQFIPEFGHSPVWSLLSASGLASFPVLSGIECLWIAADHDAAGLRAAHECGRRWMQAGREVFVVRPAQKQDDLNDLIKRAAYA